MPQVKNITSLYFCALLIFFCSFLFVGITTPHPISLDYNVPLAQSIISGHFIDFHSNDIYIYFPGASNSILGLFILLHVPNLFGLFSWFLLFISCYILGKTFGLTKDMSII